MARSTPTRLLWPLAVLAVACGGGNPIGGGSDGGPDGGGVAVDASVPSTDGGTTDADAGWDAGAGDAGWRSLFNGVDLTGWQRYLGSPGAGQAPLGFENDPLQVYTVVREDGESAIHVSGQVWGSLISTETFGDFELEVEFKWGTHAYPPLGFLDSGLMYLTFGPAGAVNAGGLALSDPIGSGAFQVSMEYQLAGGDVGGIYNLGPIQFLPGPRVHAPEPQGWNQARIVFSGGTAIHFLNRQQVASGSAFVSVWPGTTPAALTRGKLQLQCEGGEIFFRHLRLRDR